MAEKTALITDPLEAAKAARLRYVNDQGPGIQRQRRGSGFSYYSPGGELITDKAERERINALVIPPAWTEVWISPWKNGHILATGRDAKGRKQYIYHPRWRDIRDQTKFNRMIQFSQVLLQIRERTDQDLRRHGLPREKVLAAVVRLLETTLIRIGNDEYARDNNSFGLTTLRDWHVTISDTWLEFDFDGKSGKHHVIDVKDRRLARVVKSCQELPGHELFQYVDENGNTQTIDSGDVNDYLREITGEDITAKDFRTWGGTVLAVKALMTVGPCQTETEAKKNIAGAVKQVAAQLGNTTTVCRKYYIHPTVLACYKEGTLCQVVQEELDTVVKNDDPYGLSPDETAMVGFLRRCAVDN